MNYIGDFAEDSTIYIPFTTNNAAGAAVAPSSAFEVADVDIYKNGAATQKATANGVTMTSPFDSVTGLHLVAIDTSVDTGDTGFWTTGADYTVVLTPDETVDSQTITAVLAQFSIENRFAGSALFEKAAKMLINKAVQNKVTGIIQYYDDDDTTVILTHTPIDDESTITRTPS